MRIRRTFSQEFKRETTEAIVSGKLASWKSPENMEYHR